MNELLCKLSEFEFIKIITKDSINFDEVDFCCSTFQAFFLDNKQQSLCIGQQFAGMFFEEFIQRLKKVVDGKLPLHESITQNLGIMENKLRIDFPRKNKKFIMVSSHSGESMYWVGVNYEVWTTFDDINPHVATWLYNDKEGNIILEVSKLYKWAFIRKNRKDPEYETYDEFMKDYKSLIHRVIPRDVAIQWLKDSMKVYRSFFENEADFISMSNKNL